jgi:hypothetical protein
MNNRVVNRKFEGLSGSKPLMTAELMIGAIYRLKLDKFQRVRRKHVGMLLFDVPSAACFKKISLVFGIRNDTLG